MHCNKGSFSFSSSSLFLAFSSLMIHCYSIQTLQKVCPHGRLCDWCSKSSERKSVQQISQTVGEVQLAVAILKMLSHKSVFSVSGSMKTKLDQQILYYCHLLAPKPSPNGSRRISKVFKINKSMSEQRREQLSRNEHTGTAHNQSNQGELKHAVCGVSTVRYG